MRPKAWSVIAAVMVLIGIAHAKPFVPESDAVVLERLPEKFDPSLAELKRMRAALAARPQDASLAARLARRAVEASRATGDPRFLGQAQAALAPWWSASSAPAEILLLRATIKQSLHDFPAALDDLDRVLAAAPHYGQARLTRAAVLTVLGRYSEARRDCAALERLTTELVVVACEAAPMSLDGRAAEAYAMLAASLSRSGGTAPAVLSWAHALAGEIAARRGEPAQAERHFRVALAADAQDAYVRAAYADFLIEQRRPREAAAWVRDDLRNDVLLLRLALAEAAYADASPAEQRSFAQHRADLAARFAASRARGDAVHRREEARYALAIERDAPRALALARANWGVQREPADLYVLAQAAKAAGDVAALERVRSWQSEHRLEDATLGAITGDQP